MLRQLCLYYYRIRKPRVATVNSISLLNYRKELRDARRNVHIEANEYQDKIQNQYIAEHREEMKKKHFDNQCDFRKKVIQTSFKLLCDLKTLARSDQAFEARLNKLLHEEELRKLNRRRIIKIMSHESENYWFNEENADERLDSEVIFPEYIASTEYYHRLHAEALAYENFDYDLLDKVTSNEEAVKEKNKMLIPLFAALRQKIIAFKDDTDDLKQIQILTEVERIKSLNLPQEEAAGMLEIAKQKMLQPKTKEEKQARLVSKIRKLVAVLQVWKEYTVVLGLTSAQILKKIYEKDQEKKIASYELKVMGKLKKQAATSFVGSAEEDTEDKQISLTDYLASIESAEAASAPPEAESINTSELKELLNSISPKKEPGEVTLVKQDIDMGAFLTDRLIFEGTDPEISPQYRHQGRTMTAVEILKDLYKSDQSLVELLDQVGQVSMDYPKLFEKIWEITNPE